MDRPSSEIFPCTHDEGEAASAWRVIVEQAPDAILLLDRDQRCIMLSAGAVEMSGHRAEEVLGASITEFLDPADLAAQPFRAESLRAGETILSERKMRRKDGTIVDVESMVRSLPDGRTIVVARDITTRKTAEAERRVAEERLRLFETATDGLYDSDLLSGTTWCSDNLRALLGRDAMGSALDVDGWASVVHPDDAAGARAALADSLEREETFLELEYRLRQADGTFIWVRDKAQIFRDAGGRAVRIVGAIADITARKNAERALRDSEERFRALIENTADAFGILDAGGIYLYQSHSYGSVFGYGPDELLGRSAFELIHPADVERILAVFQDGIGRPGIVVRDEFRYLHKDGSWRDLEVTAQNLIDHPAVAGVVITSRDVTHRNATERQLRHSERLSALGRLAGTMSHEFNNVLMSIQPFADLIPRRSSDPKLIDAGLQIAHAVQRGKRVTHDILRHMNIAEPTLVPLDATSWVERAVADARPLLPTNVEVEILLPGDPVAILADPGQLDHALANLLLNAGDALPGGGKIRIRLWLPRSDVQPFGVLRDARGRVMLSVEDEGDGIAPENLGRVFEPLFTTKSDRAGLGLAVAHQIVLGHGGEIFIESTPGHGTTFHIALQRNDRGGVSATRSTHSTTGPKRLLLVEDEMPIAEGLAALLELDGFEVTIAGSGESGLAALRASSFDVLVLDVGLPDMSGIDAYRTIAAEQPDLPVIFSTGHAEEGGGFAAGGRTAFLRKPYAYEDLTRAIREILSSK
jgi:PAS domain S-box-containing protein